MTSIRQEGVGKYPKKVEGKHAMWTFTTVETNYNDGTIEKTGTYDMNQDFLKKLPKSKAKFDENTPMITITAHFNTNVLKNTRIGVVAESFINKRNEGIVTLKELKKLKQSIVDLSNRPKISLLIALKFKLMLEYYGFTDILVD